MSKNLAEFCALIIDATYGELPARIFTTLLAYGRTPIGDLIRNCQLPAKHIRHGLVVLIQQGLALYHTSPDDGITVYEANVRSAYNLVRAGKHEQMVHDLSGLIGRDAANLMSTLHYYGHAGGKEILDDQDAESVEKGLEEEEKLARSEAVPNGDTDILNGTSDQEGSETKSKVNGEHNSNGRPYSAPRREDAAISLFGDDLAVRVRDEDFMPPTDFHALVAKAVTQDAFEGEVKGARATKEFNLAMAVRKVDWLDDNRAAKGQLRDTKSNGVTKRGRDGSEEVQAQAGQSSKRRKTNGGETVSVVSQAAENGDAVTDKEEAPPSWNAFRINSEKMQVSQRSLYLHDLAVRRFGVDTAAVYLKTLRCLERRIPRCHDEYPEVDEDLDDGDDTTMDDKKDEREFRVSAYQVAESWGDYDYRPKAVDAATKKTKPDDDEDMALHLSDDDEEPSYAQKKKNSNRETLLLTGKIEQHLHILCESSPPFLKAMGDNNYGCDYQVMTRHLMQFELDNLISARFGATAKRIAHILYEKGKLDEKQLGALGMMRQKDLRGKLTAMQEAGYVDTQEIPRDNSRQPSRTIYLWFYDQDRMRKLVLNDIYKAMSRLLQRIKVEREKVHTVIEKAERLDVRGHEDKYLTNVEREALWTWRECEEKLLVQLSRQDDLVALLRDFLPLK